MSESSEAQLPSQAEVSFQRAAGQDVSLLDAQRLSSPHGLWRCRVEGGDGLPASVIVKQVTTTEFTNHVDGGVSPRLLNEWVALQFLATLEGAGPWPRLLAASRDGGLVVIEDLGNHPTIEDLLLGDRLVDAARVLAGLGSALGSLHAAARDRAAEFSAARDRIGGEAPRSDSTSDIRTVAGHLRDCFDYFEIALPSQFWSEVDLVETEIHSPGRFQTLIHADAGPQNFIWTGTEARLIDYEFATQGHGLLDLVSTRLGFPHSSDGATVPLDIVDIAEQAYRRAVQPTMPEVDDQALFGRSLTDACAHWALWRCAVLWRRLFVEQEAHPVDSDTARRRSQAYTIFRRFIDASDAADHRHAIATVMRELTEALRRHHPALAETAIYPALRVD